LLFKITCHNLESLKVLSPSKISTGNVNLNKKPRMVRAGSNISSGNLDISGIIHDYKDISSTLKSENNKSSSSSSAHAHHGNCCFRCINRLLRFAHESP
jgi:hypothetical protein